MDKSSMMGALPPPLGPAAPDAIIGALIGASTAMAATTAIPLLGVMLLRKHTQVGLPLMAWYGWWLFTSM